MSVIHCLPFPSHPHFSLFWSPFISPVSATDLQWLSSWHIWWYFYLHSYLIALICSLLLPSQIPDIFLPFALTFNLIYFCSPLLIFLPLFWQCWTTFNDLLILKDFPPETFLESNKEYCKENKRVKIRKRNRRDIKRLSIIASRWESGNRAKKWFHLYHEASSYQEDVSKHWIHNIKRTRMNAMWQRSRVK